MSADASSYGLGAVLLQQSESAWRRVAYASRAMTETETRYAQIEKVLVATTWACEWFSNCVLGRTFQIESDHKPDSVTQLETFGQPAAPHPSIQATYGQI